MPVIVVGEEKNFAALRPRLFAGAKLSPTAAKAAAEAIAAANPHTNLDKLEPGTVLTVPDDVPKLSLGGRLSFDQPTKSAVSGLAATGKSTLDAISASAKELEKQSIAGRKELTKTLDAEELATAARRDKTLRAALGAATQAMEQQEAEEKQRAAALDTARKTWSAEFDALTKLLPQEDA